MMVCRGRHISVDLGHVSALYLGWHDLALYGRVISLYLFVLIITLAV